MTASAATCWATAAATDLRAAGRPIYHRNIRRTRRSRRPPGSFVSAERPEVPDRPAGRQRLGGRDDGLGVDAVVPVEVGEAARLAEVLHSEGTGAVAADGAQPGERRRVAVEHRHDAAVGRQLLEEPLDMASGVNETALAGAARRRPAG